MASKSIHTIALVTATTEALFRRSFLCAQRSGGWEFVGATTGAERVGVGGP